MNNGVERNEILIAYTFAMISAISDFINYTIFQSASELYCVDNVWSTFNGFL